MPALAGARSPAARTLGSLTGLAISPAALRAAPDVGIPGLPSDFAPVILVSHNALRAMSPEAGVEVILHELGHAQGHPHSSTPDDLMNPNREIHR